MVSHVATELPPVHPGEILIEEFLKPLGLSPYKAAALMAVPRTRVERIASGAVGVTADTALRLGKLLGTTPQFWLNLQSRYDLLTLGSDVADKVAAIQTIVAGEVQAEASRIRVGEKHYPIEGRGDARVKHTIWKKPTVEVGLVPEKIVPMSATGEPLEPKHATPKGSKRA